MLLSALALPYYERLVNERTTSQYLDKVKKRIAELNAAAPKGSRP